MPHLSRAERRELADLDRRYPQQWLIPRELQPHYYDLFAKDEADYAAEIARMWKWERRRPALRTLADVLFWLVAIPFFVIMAINGAWLTGSVFVGMAWLGLRCEWSWWPWRKPL
ncbi:MAG TPA: hypothetical protein VLQ80_29275 [Candidatus Saccharimonadia bacterium]|nr:hypothetical protein [Candidatus Saccharimonadia bacterium]